MTTVDGVIRVARGEIGYREGFSDGHWNNVQKYAAAVPGLAWANGQPWCATFVSWVALKAGCADLYPRTASCDVGAQWFKDRKRWSEYPAVGAQVFFGVPGDANHTGIVVSYTADTITTVEGNTNDSGSREGNGVYLKQRPRRGVNILGYGYPKFPEGIKSADPAWAHAAPAPVVRRTRGKAWDEAIRAVAALQVSGPIRGAAKKAALVALRSVPFLKG